MHHPPLTILAIETSCDETSLAVVRAWGDLDMPRFEVLRHIITSQIDLHRPFGGVVPSLAKREHIAALPLAWDQLFSDTSTPPLTPGDIDLIAVTVGPGLEPALWAGITFAQQHATALGIPLIGVSHMEGHLYSFLLDSVDAQTHALAFPMISLLVSGGHTLLVLSENLTKKTVIGQTRGVGEILVRCAVEIVDPGSVRHGAVSAAAVLGDYRNGIHAGVRGNVREAHIELCYRANRARHLGVQVV
jgi:N6-L-threonylcarbamoyladenine synthase